MSERKRESERERERERVKLSSKHNTGKQLVNKGGKETVYEYIVRENVYTSMSNITY